MGAGNRCGDRRVRDFGPTVGIFLDGEGGYTTIAVALALLVSLTLVFSVASAEWVLSRSAEVQEVADATAMAGSNCVAAFSTVVQVIDACVLSLGLAGVLVFAAGMVVAAVPFLQAKSPAILHAGRQLLDARRTFATSASEGLERFELVLPALIMANSASCVSANCRGGLTYVGCAVPFPQTSETDYSFLDEGPDPAEMEESAEQLREATEEKERALQRAQAAKERAWRADCVNAPMCMRSRAATLAGMTSRANPSYASAEAWQFEYARLRAKNYYLLRERQEAPLNSSPEELSRSAARKRFYAYAYEEVSKGTCSETDPVVMDLPELPHTRATVRASRLYTDVCWPCTSEDGGRVIHSTLECPGATGASDGAASLEQLEQGLVGRCDVCGMDVAVMGSTAHASTNINNGFEHYWRIVVQASRDYQAAREEAAQADARMKELAEKNSNLFQQAIDALSVDRPRIRPAGYQGCVSLVLRKGGVAVPSELTGSFISGTSLPPGVAMSAATLAPDSATDGNDILSRAFDGLRERWGAPVDLVGHMAELWGRLLVGYGSTYESVSGVAESLLDDLGSLFGERVASWLRGKLTAIVDACGFQPADMRLRKPVLVRSQRVLDQAGLTNVGEARALIEALPASAEEIRTTNWGKVLEALGGSGVEIATLPIPGRDGESLPLSLDLASMVGMP